MSLSFTLAKVNLPGFGNDILDLTNITGGIIETTDIVVSNISNLKGNVTFVDDVLPEYTVSNVGYIIGELLTVSFANNTPKGVTAVVSNVDTTGYAFQTGDFFPVQQRIPFSFNATFRYNFGSPAGYGYIQKLQVNSYAFSNVTIVPTDVSDNTNFTVNISGTITSSNITNDSFTYVLPNNTEQVFTIENVANVPSGSLIIEWTAPDDSGIIFDNRNYELFFTVKNPLSLSNITVSANINQNLYYSADPALAILNS